jgi:diguanylate cyclase (GGDEF)-like protein
VPSQETLLAVILAAISLNLLLAIGILVSSRRRRSAAVVAAPRGRFGRPAELPSAPRPMIGVFMEPPHGQHQTDPQTGLELAATWDRWLLEEDARTRRYRRPTTIVVVEIDGLDRLVERLGPAAADRLISPVAETLRKHGRRTDLIARLGKARFGAILVETDEVQAINYIERVRSAADLWLAAGAVALRLSIGWAEANGSRTMEDAARAADERLHHERRRNGPVEPPAVGDGPIVEPAVG